MSEVPDPSTGTRMEVVENLPVHVRLGLPGTFVIVAILLAVLAMAIDNAPRLTPRQSTMLIVAAALAIFGFLLLGFRWLCALVVPTGRRPRIVIDHATRVITFERFTRERRRFAMLHWGADRDVTQTISFDDVLSCGLVRGGIYRSRWDMIVVTTVDARFVAAALRGHPQLRLADERLKLALPTAKQATDDLRTDHLYSMLLLFGALAFLAGLIAISWKPLGRLMRWW